MATFIQAGIVFLVLCWKWCIVQACKHNEHKVKCYHDVGVPGDLCPGVQRWPCSGTKKRCACVQGTSQRWDGYCVPHRDCVFRTHQPDKLLSLNEDLVMVGTSTTIFNQNTLRCFVSSLVEPVYYNYHRLVKYQILVKGKWEHRQYDLKMITEYYGERLIAEEVFDLLPYGMDGFPVLHADQDCIILSRLPPLGNKTECTYWVRKSVVRKSQLAM
ncbi:uncharacterized protein LOC119458265 [Dermacentor silvarum]|uniref:uncharacterized protein LOC119458265 n=1 Tax=Dermacentor silvarum TaxID=543639 RepID=UPI0021006E3D|nr:uncharacterized protein LOC119458265 [Dermacentor silvarum]XP_049526913.1 uncharacterized protein LOC119458265 [Dermacentor silvarum]XP_049526914.1 uncharacterized protein LOC119458265 [Dermacentor silvarum]XP_049526915.1 uncharacterized protein LOC119458265 [Dermacentor silvarum]XP_049526916.1 uncharacterized protein LOC119458265 [Dermacentor silvarum]